MSLSAIAFGLACFALGFNMGTTFGYIMRRSEEPKPPSPGCGE